MPMNTTLDERRTLAAALLSLSVSAAGWSMAAAWLALRHMEAAAALCGPTVAHCGWCAASAAGLAASLVPAGLALALLRPPASRLRA